MVSVASEAEMYADADTSGVASSAASDGSSRRRSSGPRTYADAGEPSPIARVIVFLLPALSSRTRAYLARLVSHHVAAPSSQLIRHARLGLLVRLLRDRQAELISTREYEAARCDRRNGDQAQEDWPTASTLVRAFGSWHTAQFAALGLAFRRNRRGVARSSHHHGGRREYTRDEVIQSLTEARETLGVWLSGNEWNQFGVLRREAARAAGLAEPRIPSLKPINRLFGNYEHARQEAILIWGGGGEPKHPELWEKLLLPDSGDDVNERVDDDATADAISNRLWKVIRHLSGVDLRSIYLALSSLAHGGAESPRTALCRNALIACQHDRPDQRVSRRIYDTWHRAHETEGWPSSSVIRGSFGTWANAMEAAGLAPLPNVAAHRLVSESPDVADAEILKAVRLCASEHPDVKRLRFIDFRKWGLAELARDDRRFAWIPVNKETFSRRFGGWPDTLVAAGLSELATTATSGRFHKWTDADGEAAMLDALREAAASFPDGEITCKRYDQVWAPAERRRRFKVSDRRPIPGSEIIVRHFGCWADALLAAGLINEAEHRRRRFRRGVKMSNAQLAACAREAIALFGPGMTRGQYMAWREQRLQREDAPEEGLPTTSWLVQQLGDGRWARTVEVAINWPD